MGTIYENSVQAVKDGARFNVNLQARSLSIDGRYVIKDGEFSGELGTQPFTTDWLDVLYIAYRYSVPSERSESCRPYFHALREADLSDEDMMYGMQRDVAQIQIELFVLCSILNGSLSWNDEWGSWFWQSKVNPDLVLLRSWVD